MFHFGIFWSQRKTLCVLSVWLVASWSSSLLWFIPTKHTTLIMARGPKKHLKRLNAPKHWMLDKMGGAWAPRPSQGPHKLRECLPIILILRNRLKYALNRREVQQICMEKLVQVDGKIRTDPCFPAGFMGTYYLSIIPTFLYIYGRV